METMLINVVIHANPPLKCITWIYIPTWSIFIRNGATFPSIWLCHCKMTLMCTQQQR